jgi:hypothetical protein
MSDDPKKPWHKQSYESSKAYKGFTYYLEERDRSMFDAYIDYCEWNWSKKRSQQEVAQRIDRQPPAHFRRWCSEHKWVNRRAAYYDEIDQIALNEMMATKARRKVERILFLDRVKDELEHGIPNIKTALDPAEFDLNAFVRAIDKVFSHYRDELDEQPTQKLEHSGSVDTNFDPSQLDTDDLSSLVDLLERGASAGDQTKGEG